MAGRDPRGELPESLSQDGAEDRAAIHPISLPQSKPRGRGHEGWSLYTFGSRPSRRLHQNTWKAKNERRAQTEPHMAWEHGAGSPLGSVRCRAEVQERPAGRPCRRIVLGSGGPCGPTSEPRDDKAGVGTRLMDVDVMQRHDPRQDLAKRPFDVHCSALSGPAQAGQRTFTPISRVAAWLSESGPRLTRRAS